MARAARDSEGAAGEQAWASAPGARVHGGLDARELAALGLSPAQVVDFSVNLNPYGPCPSVLEAARTAPLVSYPDAEARAARAAWARTLQTSPERIAVGHGAADLFWAITRALVAKDDRVVIAEPTFSELRIAAAAAGARVERVMAREGQGFRLPLTELARRAHGARLLYLCAPNNPTGEAIAAESIAQLARELPHTLVVLDQSFLSLSDRADEASFAFPENVICVRSLTKDFALAGLRIGLSIAAPELVRRIEAARPTWATSAPALLAIEAAAEEQVFVRESWARMRRDRERVGEALRAVGLVPLPSSTGFQLVRVGRAAAFRAALLARGVSVRDASSFGLPGYVRIAARPEAEVARLAEALRAIAPDIQRWLRDPEAAR